jgi:hypothetical protein
LTRATSRGSGRSPAPAPNPSYTSFPSLAQMDRDRAASVAHDASLKKAAAPPAARKSLALTFLTFLASAPALLGMCCWPSLAAAVVGGVVTGAARSLSHTLSFIFTAVVLVALITYSAYCTRERAQLHSSRVQVYGPFSLLCFAALLVIADPLRHVLQDGGVWDGPSSDAFREGCGEGWGCLTATGVLFMCVFTYAGFVLLFTANMWNANILQKIRFFAKQWKEVKAEHAAARLAEKEAKRATQAEEEQAAAAAASNVSRPSASINFGALHLSMQPPAIFFRKEETNKIGYRVTERPAPAGLPANMDAHIRQAGEYRAEGYSYEVDSDVAESVIKVTPSGRQQSTHVAGASSPTVTSSPNSRSSNGDVGLMSPLSNIALTPLHTHLQCASPIVNTMEKTMVDKHDSPSSSPTFEKKTLHYVPEGRALEVPQ